MGYFKRYWKRTGRKRTGKEVSCKICGKVIYRKGYQIKKYPFHYCSLNCKGIDNAKRLNKYYEGRSRSWQMGKKNSSWKGEKAGYQAKHDWIRLHYGKANKCENIESHKF